MIYAKRIDSQVARITKRLTAIEAGIGSLLEDASRRTASREFNTAPKPRSAAESN